jgi:DNA-binding transcriptional LysR family regulator
MELSGQKMSGALQICPASLVYDPRMELLELRAFLAVVNEGSFSRAALRLQRTQPAVSQAVKRLENELGQKLFDRSSNPGSLTEAGTVLRDYAERVLKLTDEAQASVREIDDLRRGRVLIGSNDTGIPILLPLIAEFQAEFPNILVDVRRFHTRKIPVEVLHGNLDFGFVTFHASEGGLRDLSLGDDELVAVVHPSHPYAKKAKLTVSEWAEQPIVFHSEPSQARERVMKIVDSRGVKMNVRLAIPSLDGIRLAVEMNLGLSLLPRRCVASEVRRKQLVAIPIPELRLPRQMRLIYRRAPRLSKAASAFLETAAHHNTDATDLVRRANATPARAARTNR